MGSPENLRYTSDHEWARREDDGSLTVGITDHAQDALGDVVYIELPEEGDTVEEHGRFGEVESVKTTSELFAPVAGEVAAVNSDLVESEAWEKVNEDPYGEGWLIRLMPSDPAAFDALMDAAAYDKLLAEEG